MLQMTPDIIAYLRLTEVLGIRKNDKVKAMQVSRNGRQSRIRETRGKPARCPKRVSNIVLMNMLIPAEQTISIGINRHIAV